MKANNLVIIVSALLLVVAFVKRNEFPSGMALVPSLQEEPQQTPVRKAPFAVSYNDIEYRVRPQFRYAIDGLVVSYRYHDGKSRMHARSNDHLNMMDLCVVWGSNADPSLLNALSFWSGIFTCNVKTSDRQVWDQFDMFKLSNNHLISGDERIRSSVRGLKIGDQIRVEGYLASYGTGGNERGTSTTRDDTGNGACETIYVEDFTVLKSVQSPWRLAMWASLGVLLLGLANHFRRPYQPYRRPA